MDQSRIGQIRRGKIHIIGIGEGIQYRHFVFVFIAARFCNFAEDADLRMALRHKDRVIRRKRKVLRHACGGLRIAQIGGLTLTVFVGHGNMGEVSVFQCAARFRQCFRQAQVRLVFHGFRMRDIAVNLHVLMTALGQRDRDQRADEIRRPPGRERLRHLLRRPAGDMQGANHRNGNDAVGRNGDLRDAQLREVDDLNTENIVGSQQVRRRRTRRSQRRRRLLRLRRALAARQREAQGGQGKCGQRETEFMVHLRAFLCYS